MRLMTITVLVFSISGQILHAESPPWTRDSQRRAEEKIAQRLDGIRVSAGLTALHRAQPSKIEVQLVCTAAVTGKEPNWGELVTYLTEDLSFESPILKRAALGEVVPTPGNGFSSVPLIDKEWPRYSVVVYLDSASGIGHPRYRIGVARRLSRVSELVDPLTAEDSNGWKQQVAPSCKGASH
jgi:hypothetical protein